MINDFDSGFSRLNTRFGDAIRFDQYFSSQTDTSSESTELQDTLRNPYANYLDNTYQEYSRNIGTANSRQNSFRNTLDAEIAADINTSRVFGSVDNLSRTIFSSFSRNIDKSFDNSFIRRERDYLFRSLSDDPFKLGVDTESYVAVRQSLDNLIWQDISHAPQNLTHLNHELDRYTREQEIKDTFRSIDTTSPDVIANATATNNRLIEDMTYVNRPGILPAVGLIKGASRELYIDIYQLNNPVARNYIYNKILLNLIDKNPDNNIKFNFRLAAPVEGAGGQTTYDILGDNLLFYRGLELLKQEYGEKAEKMINFRFADAKSHPKFLLSEGAAIIGSMNLTNPLGQSIYQSGSNYESIRVLHNKTANNTDFNTLTITQIEAMADLDPEAKMFAQAQRLMKETFTLAPGAKPAPHSGYANITRPFEIYNQLEKTLNYLDDQRTQFNVGTREFKKTNFSAILNQPFLLQHEEKLFTDKVLSGEMRTAFGDRIDPPYVGALSQAKIKNYKTLQSRVLNQLIENSAHVVVDNHNYRERVANPIYETLLSDGTLGKFDNSISNLVRTVVGDRQGKSAQTLIRTLQQGMKKQGMAMDESMARQLLAMTSGNIDIAAVPRVHSKMFIATVEGKAVSSYMGSSNLGFFSLADTTKTDLNVNDEIGFSLIQAELRDQMQMTQKLRLTKDQEDSELAKALANHHTELSRLGRRRGQLKYNDLNQESIQSAFSDRNRLESLFQQLKTIAKETDAFSPERIFNSRGDFNEVAVTIGEKGKSQRVYRFNATQDVGNSGNSNFLAVDQGKLITPIQYANETNLPLYTGFRDGSGEFISVAGGARTKFSAEQATIALISSIAYESRAISLVKAPVEFYLQNYSQANLNLAGGAGINTDMLATAGMNYVKSIFATTDVGSTLNYSANQIQRKILTNILARYERGTPELNQIMRMSGVNLDDQVGGRSVREIREAGFRDLAQSLAEFSQANLADRKAILGFGADSQSWQKSFSGKLFNKLDSLVNGTVGGAFIYADLLYDVINSQNNYLYQASIKDKLKQVHVRNFEPWLTPTQGRVYGATQAANRTPLYGINQKNEKAFGVINAAQSSIANGNVDFNNLAAYALLNNPLDFGPADFIGDGDPAFAKVAEGAGSKGGTSDAELMAGYLNVLPMKYDQTVGDLYSLKLIEDTGVGSIIKQSDVDTYLAGLNKKGIINATIGANLTNHLAEKEGTSVNFYFDDRGKEASIPQRLKNVIGSRPLLDLSTYYQLALEVQSKLQEKDDNDKLIFDADVIAGMAKAYGKSLGYKVTDAQKKAFNSQTVAEIYLSSLKSRLGNIGKADLSQRIDSSFQYGAIFSGEVKSFLSTSQAEALRAVTEETQQEFGLDAQDTEHANLLRELTRARIVGRQLNNSQMAGLIGARTREGSRQVNVVALGGAFSDYAYGNPYYGQETFSFGGQELNLAGLRRGFFDQSTKSIKGSLFTPNSDITADLQALVGSMDSMSGGSVGYDKRRDSYVLYDLDGNEKQVITSRKEIKVLSNVLQEAGYNPSAGTVTATSNAASIRGEQAIENLFKVNILDGSDATNEVRIQLNFVRTLLEGGARRIEALNGLFKAPLAYLATDMMDQIYGEIKDSVTFAEGRNSLRDIYTIASTNNLKSYFFDHGAAIVTDKLFKGRLNFYDQQNGNIGSQVATALLLSFNLDSFGGADTNTKDALYKTIGETDSNSFLKLLQTAELINNPVTTAYDVGRNILGKGEGDQYKSKQTYGALQSPLLQMVDLGLITSALGGNAASGQELINILDGTILAYDDTGVFKYLENNLRGREMATVAGNVDFMLQMINNKAFTFKQVALKVDQSSSSYQYLSSIMGADYDTQINPNDQMREIVEDLANRVPYVTMFSGLSGSQSKVPVSSKKLAQLEFQHLVSEPFMGQLNAFKQGGSLDSLRQVMGTTLGFMTNSSVARQVMSMANLSSFDFTQSRDLNNPYLKSQLIAYYTNPLTAQGNLKDDRNTYKFFSVLNNVNQDVDLIKKIVNRGTKNRNYKNLYAENSRLQNLVELVNQDINNSTVRQQIQENIGMGLYEIEDKFKLLAYQYKADTSKILNIEQAEAVSSNMQKSGLQRFAFALPGFAVTEGGIEVNRNQKFYGFVIGGEDVKVIGEQFGEFQSEISKYVLDIWGGLAPGGEVRGVLEMIASSTETEFDLSPNLIGKLEKFYASTTALQTKLYDTFTGRQLEEIFGNKVRLKGGTAVAAASFFVPERMQIGGKAMLDKHNSTLNREKAEVLTGLQGYGNDFDKETINTVRQYVYDLNEDAQTLLTDIKTLKRKRKTLRKVQAQQQEKIIGTKLDEVRTQIKKLRESISPLDKSHPLHQTIDRLNDRLTETFNWWENDSSVNQNYKRYKNRVSRKIRNKAESFFDIRAEVQAVRSGLKKFSENRNLVTNLMQSQMQAIQVGMSAAGTSGLVKLNEMSGQIQAEIGLLRTSNLGNALDINARIDQQLDVLYNRRDGKASGDALVKYASIAELKILKGQLREQVNTYLGNSDPTPYESLLAEAEANRAFTQELRNKTPFVTSQSSLLIGQGYAGAKLSQVDYLAGGMYSNLSSSLRLSKYGTSVDALSSFIGGLKNDFLPNYDRQLDQLTNSFGDNNLTATEFKLRNRQHIIELQTKLTSFENSITSLESSNLQPIEQKDRLADVRFELEIELNKFSALSALDYVQSFRSPPPGNLELARSMFGVGRIEDLNQLTQDMIQSDFFDVERNQTLTLFNPHSMLVTMLGDFDGDTISSVFVHKGELELKLNDAKTHHQYLSQSGNASASQLKGVQKQITTLTNAINKIDSNLDVGNYEDSIRDWTANYLKLDRRLLKNTPIATMLSWVEQGRGLYDNYLGSVYESVEPLHKDLKLLSQNLGDTSVAKTQINSLLTNTKDKDGKYKYNILKKLIVDNSFGDDDLLKIFTDPADNRDFNIRKYITNIGTNKKAYELAVKYTNKSAGSDLSLDQVAGLQKALGQAGAVILGKTYNTTIGMLYTQAPVLVIANVLLENSELAKQAEGILKENGQNIDNILTAAKNAKSHAQQMGGFLQGVHQLIRDSIKPKGSITEFLSNMTEITKELNEAPNKEARDLVLDKMTKLVDVDPLLDLDTFVGELQTLNSDLTSGEIEAKQKQVKRKLGLDQYHLDTYEERLNYFAGDGNVFYGEGKGNKLALTAAYSTKQKLVGLSAKFAYEGLIAKETLPGVKGAVEANLNNLDSDSISQIESLTKAAQSAFNDPNFDRTSLSVEAQEYVEFTEKYILDSDDSPFTKDITTEQKILAVQYLDTKSSVDLFAGKTGAKLIDFAKFNNLRESMYGKYDENSPQLISTDIGKGLDPNSATLLQAMSTGNIDSVEKMSKATDNLITGYMATQNMTEAEATAHLYKHLLNNTNLIADAEDNSQRQIVEAATILLDQTKDSEFTDSFLRHLSSSEMGMQSASVKSIVQNSAAYNFDNSDDALASNIMKDFDLNATEASRVVSRVKVASTRSTIGMSDALTNEIAAINAGRKMAQPKLIKYKNVLKKLPNSADIGAEVGLFPLLGLIGNVMATGDVSPEAIQNSIGGIITATSYATNTGTAKQAAFNFGIGTAFKARLGLSQADPVAGLASMIGQELAFAVGGSAITGRASNFISNQLLGKPKNTLDFDQFAGARNFTSNILGGAISFLATSLITRTLTNKMVKASAAYSALAPVVDLVAAQIKATATAFNQARANGVLAEDIVDLSITDIDADTVATVDDLYYTIDNPDVDYISDDEDYEDEYEYSVVDEQESEFALAV